MSNIKSEKRIRRHKRIRAKISGTSTRPRLAVFKSNKRLIAQIIDDTTGQTLVFITDDNLKGNNKTERARNAGSEIAALAKKKNIEKVVFDRGGFLFAGRIKAFTEGAREAGLVF